MKAVGWTTKNIRSQITLEIFLQSIAGAIFGTVTGLALSFGLSMIKISAPLPWQGSPIPNTNTSAAVSELIPLDVRVSPLLLGIVCAGTIIIALICSLSATRKVGTIKPASLLRTV